MQARNRHAVVMLVLTAFFGKELWILAALAQQVAPGKTKPDVHVSASRVPNVLAVHFLAIGDRLQKPGNERISLRGVMTIAGVNNAAQVVVEKGGKVSVVTPGKDLKYDGTAAPSGVSEADRGFVESFAEDTVETLMEAVAQGVAGVNLVGQRFPDGQGGLCDLYDVPLRSTAKSGFVRFKWYCFDPTTALVRWVQSPASASSGLLQDTRFSDWRTLDGQKAPGHITRVEGGLTAFAFQDDADGVSISAGIAFCPQAASRSGVVHRGRDFDRGCRHGVFQVCASLPEQQLLDSFLCGSDPPPMPEDPARSKVAPGTEGKFEEHDLVHF